MSKSLTPTEETSGPNLAIVLPPDLARELSLDKPIHAGPAWDVLTGFDLNRPREDLVENAERAAKKSAWSATHREDPEYPDARAREESATATIVECTLPLVDMVKRTRSDAAHGEKFRRGRGEGKKGPLRHAIERICAITRANTLDELLDAIEESEDFLPNLFGSTKNPIHITDVEVDHEKKEVRYRTRKQSPKEEPKEVSFGRLGNILLDIFKAN